MLKLFTHQKANIMKSEKKSKSKEAKSKKENQAQKAEREMWSEIEILHKYGTARHHFTKRVYGK